MGKHFILLLFVSMFFVGCSQISLQKKSDDSITGEWRGNSQAYKNTSIALFSDGKLTGYDGCNHFGGKYDVRNGVLNIAKPLLSTAMNCKTHNDLQDFLLDTGRFERNGPFLILYGKQSGRKVVFKSNDESFPIGKYTIVSYLLETSLHHPVSPIAITFYEGGKIKGSMGCNDIFATYKDQNGHVLISYPAQSAKQCEPSVMDEENHFLRLLERVEDYSFFNDRARLYDSNGSTLIEMTKQ